MGRKNTRGLELSFKYLSGGRGRGRWYKKISGQAHYFGWGDGVTDRESYRQALAKYRSTLEDRASTARRLRLRGLVSDLQTSVMWLGAFPHEADLEGAQKEFAELAALDPELAAGFASSLDAAEKKRLLRSLKSRPLRELRDAFTARPDSSEETSKPMTVGALLDEFMVEQRRRLERRQKLDKLRAEGQVVKEQAKQNIGIARFVSISRDVVAMKDVAGNEPWDKTEEAAAKVVRKFREWADARVFAGEDSPHTFNDHIKLAHMFCVWAEANYCLDRLPRDRRLFSKYTVSESTAKAIPIDVLRQLWQKSDDRGRCWLLLGLNCAYYAQDISDLQTGMIEACHLNHRRGKTGVNVKYKLWPKTRAYLKKLAPASGRVFSTANGTPLVHFAVNRKGKFVRIDNVQLWFRRRCEALGIEGYSFSNVRDTATTAVDGIDRSMTDLFDAHQDRRMAALYVDGKMVNTKPLDAVIDKLEQRLSIWTGAKKTQNLSP